MEGEGDDVGDRDGEANYPAHVAARCAFSYMERRPRATLRRYASRRRPRDRGARHEQPEWALLGGNLQRDGPCRCGDERLPGAYQRLDHFNGTLITRNASPSPSSRDVDTCSSGARTIGLASFHGTLQRKVTASRQRRSGSARWAVLSHSKIAFYNL